MRKIKFRAKRASGYTGGRKWLFGGIIPDRCDEWDMDLLRDFCYRAGILDEWEASDCLTFESVALKAAEILGVEIL